MCKDCGCSLVDNITISNVANKKVNRASNIHQQHKISVNQSILTENEHLAQKNRQYFQSQALFVINLLSSPGSGKTTLLEKILHDCRNHCHIGVIVGDLATDNDAMRLLHQGAPIMQITTGNACHLEAKMIAQAVQQLNLAQLDLLIIENVGNLVCPAAYDLGENLRIVLLSVTEGEDKPLKYPTMFKSADIVIINKIDLSEAVEFKRDVALSNIQKIAPQAKIFELSAKTGQGITSLLAYLLKFKTPFLETSKRAR